MPNRIIKESICTSKAINSLSDFHFRLWTCLITYVDDFGRGDARGAVIKGRCFPLRERVTVRDIDNGLVALANAGCIFLYEVDGESYLCFPKWDQHQSVRNKKSKYPAPPPIDDSCKQLNSIEINCNQMNANVPVIQSNPNPYPNPIRDGKTATGFQPPSIDDIREYCQERKNKIDPEKFHAYYAARDWYLNKGQKMKDWKAAVVYWESNEGRFDHGSGNGRGSGYPERSDGQNKPDYSKFSAGIIQL